MYEILLKLLLANGMKPAEFSRATGISEATLSTWKRRGTIGKDGCKKIADFFGVSPDYVMFGDDAPNLFARHTRNVKKRC